MESTGKYTDTKQNRFTDLAEAEIRAEIARQLAGFMVAAKEMPLSAELVIQYEGGSARLRLDVDKIYGIKEQKVTWL